MRQPTELKRFGPPSNLDHHEYGTRIIVYKDDTETIYDLWIQLGQENEPNWEYMGEYRKDDKSTIEIDAIQPD